MNRKELKNNTVELDDSALENVSGGRLIPIILGNDPVEDPDPTVSFFCAGHQGLCFTDQSILNKCLADGTYYRDASGQIYCDECTKKMGRS